MVKLDPDGFNEVLTPIGLSSAILCLIVSVGDWGRAGYPPLSGPLAVTGLLLFVTGVGVRASARFVLGRQFSMFLRLLPDHRLVTAGPYHYVRHPMYLGALLAWTGIPAAFGSPGGLALLLPLYTWIVVRIEVEEKMLASRFGKDFETYRERTRKLVPLFY